MSLLKGVVQLKPQNKTSFRQQRYGVQSKGRGGAARSKSGSKTGAGAGCRYVSQKSPWVYSNELVVPAGQNLAPGDWVALEDHNGKAMGYGYYNPHSLIAYRAFSREPFISDKAAQQWFMVRLDAAFRLRTMAYPELCVGGAYSFRLSFGEADGLPGFIVDLFRCQNGAFAVVQCHSAGADLFIEWLRQWLEARLKITKGVVRNDLDVRVREQARQYVDTWGAEIKEAHALEGGLRFYFDHLKGQKTGYFYDQRDNRSQWARLIQGAAAEYGAVLDVFSYVGAWGLRAAAANKKLMVTCVDDSRQALEWVMHNAKANGLADRVEVVKADALKDGDFYRSGHYQYVSSDPPAMSASKKHEDESRRAHLKCFTKAIAATAPGGITALSVCSYHMDWPSFYDTCHLAALNDDRTLTYVYTGGPALDHPTEGSHPEGRYLKCALMVNN